MQTSTTAKVEFVPYLAATTGHHRRNRQRGCVTLWVLVGVGWQSVGESETEGGESDDVGKPEGEGNLPITLN